MSRDPLPFVQRYPYVANNPVNLVDPAGLCLFGAPCPGLIEDAIECVGNGLDWVTEPISDAAAEAVEFVTSSYLDFNFTAGCGLVGTVGVQMSWEQGIHPYVGGTATFCGASGSATVGPYQDITSGLACGAQGGYNFPLGWTGAFQVGAGPVMQFGSAGWTFDEKEGGGFSTGFVEFGIGGSLAFGIPGIPPTFSGTFFYLH